MYSLAYHLAHILLLMKKLSIIISFAQIANMTHNYLNNFSFLDFWGCHFPSKIYENYSLGFMFVIVSCQRVDHYKLSPWLTASSWLTWPKAENISLNHPSPLQKLPKEKSFPPPTSGHEVFFWRQGVGVYILKAPAAVISYPPCFNTPIPRSVFSPGVLRSKDSFDLLWSWCFLFFA